jgi:5-methylcytosine-specific restriction endonuclease McrA
MALRNKADRLFSLAVRERDGHCQACGAHWDLQCAHILSRRYTATRWAMDGAVTLCKGCHMKYTHDPLGWEEWVTERIGARRFRALKLRARQGVAKVDLEAVVASLEVKR